MSKVETECRALLALAYVHWQLEQQAGPIPLAHCLDYIRALGLLA
jgi:hypothetical protein